MLRNKINYYGNRSENSASVHENLINTPEDVEPISPQNEEYVQPSPIIENIPEPISQEPISSEPVIHQPEPVTQRHYHMQYDEPTPEKNNISQIAILILVILLIAALACPFLMK